MNTYSLRFPGYDARADRASIRWELFLDWKIREVDATERADTLRVICEGAPDPAGWAELLTEAGFPAPELLLEHAPDRGPLAA